MDFKKIKEIEAPSLGDFDPSFKKLEGLFLIKNAALLRLAEMFGHEGAHALYAMVDPKDAVQLQRLLNDRDAALHDNKVKYPYPPDVLKKMEAAVDAGIPTETFAQAIEKIINGELRAGKGKI